MKISMNDSEGIVVVVGIVAIVGGVAAFIMDRLARRVFSKPKEDLLFSRRQFIGAGVCFAVGLALWIVT